ncbi:hypothetical protein MRB53_022974 [Persea americana]|uniref:Uncharacterized protein n=1 Tax=Persea americana TaxID=3435 RepID=A0ACC2L7Z3_PERAE|nr:hypothetical protein MRB53_022974 [Persea americana]
MAAFILLLVAEKLAQFLRVSNLSTTYSVIKWMGTELMRVHELLKEDPGLEMNRKELRKWVRDLMHAAQNIEDIVDNFNFKVERRQQQKGCMSNAFLAVKDKVARYKIVAEVMQAKEKMGRICESMPNKQVFGFDKDFDGFVKLLVEGNDPHPLYMFIVGPCGAGKTTHVREVYDSDVVKKQFPYRFWFCGHAYKFWCRDFFEQMAIMVTGGSLKEVVVPITEINMCRMISDALRGKRYLIVLDINLKYPGNINPREDLISKFMSDIREAFPDERNGSRVLVTCNDKKDADLFGQEFEVHELGKLGMLSSEEKWKLFLNTWDFDAPIAETTAGYSYLRRGYAWKQYDFGVKRIRLEYPVWDFAAMKATQYNLSHNINNEGPPDSRSSSNARGLALHTSAIYNHIFHDQKVSLPNLRRLFCFPQLTVIGVEGERRSWAKKARMQGLLISINSGDITTPCVATSGLTSSSDDGGMKFSSFPFFSHYFYKFVEISEVCYCVILELGFNNS